MDFPIKNGDFPWQNVSSPEGNHQMNGESSVLAMVLREFCTQPHVVLPGQTKCMAPVGFAPGGGTAEPDTRGNGVAEPGFNVLI